MGLEQDKQEGKALTLDQLDQFTIDLLDALKAIDDVHAVAEVGGIILTNELKELLLFVGITSKQVGTSVIFTWTEALENINHKEY